MNIKRKESYSGDMIKKVNLPWDIFTPISFKLNVFIHTTQFYILIAM